jgi:protein Tex
MDIIQKIAEELSVFPRQVQAAVQLLDEGATVPFISRYRKEVTGALDDTQLRNLEERLRYLRELEERKVAILKSIEEQGKLTSELQLQIEQTDTKTTLEDLYLPYKPKRRTKAQIAREAGLEPLALSLLENSLLIPEELALKYINPDKGIHDIKSALEGAKQILMEKFAEEPPLLGELRQYLWDNGIVISKVADKKEEEGAKFADYFDYKEQIKNIPSHRALALFRGRNENILSLNLLENKNAENLKTTEMGHCENHIASYFNIAQQNRPSDGFLLESVRWCWKVKLRNHFEVELFMQLRESAETESIKVFAANLKDLLLAAPAGCRPTIGLDPGLRTGVKVAIIDATGKMVEHGVIYPHPPKNQYDDSIKILALLAKKHQIELISIGNGTASRETDRLANDLIKRHPELNLQKLVVSEAGASVYSASELAAKEFPDLDVTIRGAVSIARRLQDPLAELVKIDPKSIGVGQYQHDVNQNALMRSLDAVVEDCVNAVGVDVNTASVSLLTRVSGLNPTLANNIIEYRNQNGTFKNRKDLLKIPRLGAKTFELAAGFLRINNGENPLDASAVHPEAYPIVEKIAQQTKKSLKSLIGDTVFLKTLKPQAFIDETFGLPTVVDILKELDKPGRDPRPEFKTASFQEGVEKLEDLKLDMILEGVITNVTNFGAFVDIGVHQDGLVHISSLSDKFVKDPREVVKAGDVVKVKVMEIDLKRKRVALSMRLTDQARDQITDIATTPTKNRVTKQETSTNFGNAFAQAFEKAKKNSRH